MTFVRNSFAVLFLAALLLVSGGALSTSAPVFNATETITVPNVITGEPMQLEVEKQPASSADAAAYMYMNCGMRYSSSLQVDVAPHGVLLSKCGGTAGAGGNSISRVRDQQGPICIYYGSTLAGCAGINNWAYVGNRSGYSGELRTQPVASR